MSTFDDDDIEFDFFDEPETAAQTQRRRLPRLERPRGGRDRPPRPPRPPLGTGGLTPLLRLVGLVALMIFIVVVLVFWVRSCQGASKHASYENYMERVTQVAQQSQRLGQQFSGKVATPGSSTKALVDTMRDYAQQAAGQVADAQSLRPPGPLRTPHQHLVDTLQLRQSGLARFGDALAQTASARDASKAAGKLVAQGQLLAASDVDWEFFFREGDVVALRQQNITGVQPPLSRFLSNPEIVGADSMVRLFQSLHGASTSNAPATGLHGDTLVSVHVLPSGTRLSPTTPTTVKSSTDLAFQVTVENSGDSQELGVPVSLTIGSAKPLVKKIDLISPGQQKTVTFTSLPANLPFGPEVKIKVEVGAVPSETNLTNNSATYPVFFSL